MEETPISETFGASNESGFKKKLGDLIKEYDKLYDADIEFRHPNKILLDSQMIREIASIVVRMQDGCTVCKRYPSDKACAVCKGMGGQSIDWWTIICGGEGVGKTTFATAYIYEYCRIVKALTGKDISFQEAAKKFVIFDDFDLIRVVLKLRPAEDKFSFIFGDEGANIFQSRDSMSSTRRMSIKFMNVMRFLRCFVVVCTVDLSQLDVILREHRIKSLVRIEKQGVYHFYDREGIRSLTQMNAGRRSLTWNWGVRPKYMGRYQYSDEIKHFIDALKNNYFKRFQMEAERAYYKELIKRLDTTATRVPKKSKKSSGQSKAGARRVDEDI